MMSTDEAIEYLINNLPMLEDEIKSNAGFFTLQIGVFARSTQSYIDSNDKMNTIFCFKIAAIILRDGDENVKNAIAVSYCESLNLNDGKQMRAWAKEIMPENLLKTYNDVNNYLDKLFSK